jgi:hypothetical protein
MQEPLIFTPVGTDNLHSCEAAIFTPAEAADFTTAGAANVNYCRNC